MKSREAVEMAKLASQFSPQIIDSIRTGRLHIETRIRRNVACIFIDVENSTSRVARIDHSEYAHLMEEFFGECFRIFISHNVTVGTFLGDGILAFANAPYEDENFKKNSINACLEVLDMHSQRRRYYLEKWKTEFNIRIGIDFGFATVGFFPSKTIGTYTAIGDTVNLAARLCSLSPVNSIAMTKQSLIQIGDLNSTIEISRGGFKDNIKGFDGEKYELFYLKPSQNKVILGDKCSVCSSNMFEESRHGNVIFLKCEKCGYRDIIEEQRDEAGSKAS